MTRSKTRSKIDDDKIAKLTVSENMLAHALALSPSQIRELDKAGLLVKRRSGFDLVNSVRKYLRRQRQTLSNGAAEKDTYGHERIRLTRARADMEEAKRQRQLGEVIPADEVEACWAGILNVARTRLLALPSRCAPRVAQAATATEVAEIIRQEIYAILDHLSRSSEAVVSFAKEQLSDAAVDSRRSVAD